MFLVVYAIYNIVNELPIASNCKVYISLCILQVQFSPSDFQAVMSVVQDLEHLKDEKTEETKAEKSQKEKLVSGF